MSKSNKSNAVKSIASIVKGAKLNAGAAKSQNALKRPTGAKYDAHVEEMRATAEAQRIADEQRAAAVLASLKAQREQEELASAIEAKRIEDAKTAAIAAGAIVKQKHANGAAFTNTRPGVLAHIENMLRAASAEAPVTKSDILASLVVAFADRDEAKMKTTVSMQVPSGFRIEKGFIISSTSTGAYYFDAAKTAEYQATHEKRGGAWRAKVATVAPALAPLAPNATTTEQK